MSKIELSDPKSRVKTRKRIDDETAISYWHRFGPDRAEIELLDYEHQGFGHRWVPARGLRLFVLDMLGCDGLTLPWRAIWMRPTQWNNISLRRHELVHIEQILRDGPIRFSLKYMWWQFRYGYWKNPYEVEAYEREPVQ
jgi:hypothetical protein